jgi:hypothetical protein
MEMGVGADEDAMVDEKGSRGGGEWSGLLVVCRRAGESDGERERKRSRERGTINLGLLSLGRNKG